MKRAFDLISTIAAAPIALPLVALTALVSLIAQGRPVFFPQVRAGKGGKAFASDSADARGVAARAATPSGLRASAGGCARLRSMNCRNSGTS